PYAYLQPPDAIPVLHGRRYRLDQGIDRVGTFGRGGAPADRRRLVALPIHPRPHARDRAWHVTGVLPRLLRRFVPGAGATAARDGQDAIREPGAATRQALEGHEQRGALLRGGGRRHRGL